MDRRANAARNRPKKGDIIRVEPFRRKEDVDAIKKLLAGNPRDHLLFVMGINNGLRVGDLLKLKVRDLVHAKPGDTLPIIENKTGKPNVLVINKAVYKALRNYLENAEPEMDHFLFRSRKGENNPLTVSAVNNYVKKWARALNLKENFGAHSLRKTWGYHQRTGFGVGFEIIAKRFNHHNPAITMRYLGIEDKEVHAVLMNEV
jgi:integrase